LTRFLKGNNSPETCRTEFYEPRSNQSIDVNGSGGVDSDRNGVVWQNWRASSHLASFDRSKCKKPPATQTPPVKAAPKAGRCIA
jgi:hypothetical protein